MRLPPGADNLTVTQNALSTTAEAIFAVRPTRHRAVVKNTDTAITVYVGTTDAVTSANGMPLLAGESIQLFTTSAIYAIAASGTPTVALVEEW